MERRDRMKHTQRSFSFLMEFVIILFFFALAATICAGFLLKAKEKEATAITLQHDLLQAQSIIEELQIASDVPFEQRFDSIKKDELNYQKGNMKIIFNDKALSSGKIQLWHEDVILCEIPFVLGEIYHAYEQESYTASWTRYTNIICFICYFSYADVGYFNICESK